MDYIQLRSDLLIILTPEMRNAILSSPYGDWTYNEDSTVVALQEYAANLLGKQAAAYVPSGVFANQCAILTAGRPGEQIIINEKSHMILNENGSIGRISRMMTKTLDCPEGYITSELLKNCLRTNPDTQSPRTSILLLQNPTGNGLIHPTNSFWQTAQLAKQHKLHVHGDCSRFFNATCELGIEPKELGKELDSISICLSKGLCAPVGSIVAGSTGFIRRFKANRKMMGGVMRKPGIVAGPALIALQKMRHEVWKDNEIARLLSSKLAQLGWFQLCLRVDTNIIYFKITDSRVNMSELRTYLAANKVKCNIEQNAVNRFVTHHYIREAEIERIVALLKAFHGSLVPNQTV